MNDKWSENFSRYILGLRFCVDCVDFLLKLFQSFEPVNNWHIYIKEKQCDRLLSLSLAWIPFIQFLKII